MNLLRFIYYHPHLRQRRGEVLDPRADSRPVELAEAATQGRDGYAGQFQRKDRSAQVRQAALDVLELGRVAPVIFGGEVEEPLGVGVGDFHRHHLAGAELAGGATALVLGEHPGVLVLELERQAGTHHAVGVGRVDNGLDVGGENIAADELDHDFFTRESFWRFRGFPAVASWRSASTWLRRDRWRAPSMLIMPRILRMPFTRKTR